MNIRRERPSDGTILRRCNICASDDVQQYLRLRCNDLTMMRCRRCGLTYVGNNPVSDENLASLYTMAAFNGGREFQSKQWYKDYYVNCLAGYNGQCEVIARFKMTLDTISCLHPNASRILDIGCATGVFLDLARRRGFETIGVDFSPELVAYAREHFNLDVRLGTVEAQAFVDGAFDVVTMLDVIEHIPKYDVLMREIRRIIAPGGLLVIRTPSENALMRSVAKLLYFASLKRFELPLLWFYSFEHVNSLSPEVLERLVSEHEMRIISLTDESESPDRLGVPAAVKAGLRIFEAFAGILGRRHKILLIARAAV
jgi:2-polyprenyl-3-methyl-5-hydroxy-6-metoxy-1,4-benzoquinol methylase